MAAATSCLFDLAMHGGVNQLFNSRLFDSLLLLDRKSVAIFDDFKPRPNADCLGVHEQFDVHGRRIAWDLIAQPPEVWGLRLPPRRLPQIGGAFEVRPAQSRPDCPSHGRFGAWIGTARLPRMKKCSPSRMHWSELRSTRESSSAGASAATGGRHFSAEACRPLVVPYTARSTCVAHGPRPANYVYLDLWESGRTRQNLLHSVRESKNSDPIRRSFRDLVLYISVLLRSRNPPVCEVSNSLTVQQGVLIFSPTKD